MTKEQKFYNALKDIFVGAKVEGESGYINLMRIKSRYYEKGVFPKLQEDIKKAIESFPEFKEELFDKLYTFFHRYFSESGSIYFRYTPLHQNVYEKVYTDDKDVILFWKTHMLYYVKTDRLFKNLEVEIDGHKFFFDVSNLEHKRANEKREIIFEFKDKRKDGFLVFNVSYSERGKKTKIDNILRSLKKEGIEITEDILERAFRVFEKQSEVDYFINKNAKEFLKEQFNIWLYQYVFSGESEWTEKRIKQLQVLKKIAFKIIDFISQFEDELVKIWNKPKFVLNSNYVITLDRIAEKDKGLNLIEKILEHKNFEEQIKEWKDLGIIDDEFNKNKIIENDLTGKHLSEDCKYLPIDTKYFKDLELEILGLFDDLDNSLDGWLIKSENYQALNTVLPKFKEKVQTIYIDPPFNAENTSEIPYMNNYKHSTWLTMMENRVAISKKLLSRDYVYIIAIDENEEMYLQQLLRDILFPSSKSVLVTVIHNRRGQQGKNFSTVHEYAIFIYPNDEKKYIGDVTFTEADVRNLRDSGSESYRTDAKNCFYPILVKNDEIVGFGDVPDDSFHPSGANEVLDDGTILVWPIDSENRERKWRYARNSIEEMIHSLTVKKTSQGYQIYLQKETTTAKTVWDKPEYDASEYGTKILQALFGRDIKEYFKFPKSLYLVKDSIGISNNKKSNIIVLDFFAGSGTTAHAVMSLNKEDGGKRKFILIEMADYFDTVIIPRIKKVAYSFNWKDGKPQDSDGIGIFFKYYELEQYEDTLRKVKYEDADLFDNPYEDPYNQYVFMKDLKLLEALEVDYENNKVKVDLSKLYPNIDLPETLSNLLGKWIKRITAEYVEFEDGEKIDLRNLDYKLIKPLIWW